MHMVPCVAVHGMPCGDAAATDGCDGVADVVDSDAACAEGGPAVYG